MKKKHLIILISFILAIKLIYLAISVSVIGSQDKVFIDYSLAVKKNDSYWYNKIAREGYPKLETKNEIGYSEGVEFTQSSWAFFPFYPYLNKLTANYLGISLGHSSFI